MRKYIYTMLVLLGGATQALQGQNSNSFGIRLGSFDTYVNNTKSSNGGYTRISGGLRMELVKDWAVGESGFWRGRLALNLGRERNPLNVNTYSNNRAVTGAGLTIGRGRRIDLAPFAFSYGGEGGVSYTPLNRLRTVNYSTSPLNNNQDIRINNQANAEVFGGMFLQLEWNVTRGIWIGVEQRFRCSILYGREVEEETYISTPIAGGAPTTTTSKTISNRISFAHPFEVPTTLFSLTFRPGGK